MGIPLLLYSIALQTLLFASIEIQTWKKINKGKQRAI